MARPENNRSRLARIRAQRVLRARRERSTAQVDNAPRAPAVPVAPPKPGAPVIALDDVHKTYALGDIAVAALRGITMQVQRGEYVAIVGASGSGKSTLMNIIGCLDHPTDGRYRLNGIDVRGMDEDTLSDVRNRQVGFVFQSFNLIPRTRAIANVELPLSYAGVARAARHQRALAALAQVGLSDRIAHLPSELSGGQQQRVAIARALVTNPAMILADEPTGALDTASSAEVMSIFAALNQRGRTVILITHEAGIARHARRQIRLSDGRVLSDERTATGTLQS
jgi:putative ABC transport system ATP-binding protein